MSRVRRGQSWVDRRRHGIFYIFWYNPITGRTDRRSLKTTDEAEARRRAAPLRLRADIATADVAETARAVWAGHARRMCKRAISNARARQRPYGLNPEIVLGTMAVQDWKCAVTGVPFSSEVKSRNPWAPSLDQIKPGQGYTPGNVRVVLAIVNMAMNCWGPGPVIDLVRACSENGTAALRTSLHTKVPPLSLADMLE